MPAATRTRWRTCATTASSATACWSSCPTATSRSPWRKLLFLAAYQLPLYSALAGRADERLAAIAAKARKESAYHLDHAALWTLRLGDGTEESHRRMQSAVDEIWPYTHELFEPDPTAPVDRPGSAPASPSWSRCSPRRR